MSHAFVKGIGEQWLHEVPPSITALIVYLTRENNGIWIYEQKKYTDAKTGKTVDAISNALRYRIDKNSRWFVVQVALLRCCFIRVRL